MAVLAVVWQSAASLKRDDRRPELQSDSDVGTLEPSEIATMFALAEVLVSPSFRESRAQTELLIAEAASRVPGLAATYRAGARLLDDRMRAHRATTFAQASLEERNDLLEFMFWRFEAETGDALHDYRAKFTRRAERVRHSEEERRLRELVVRDLLIRIHRRTAWRVMGYQNYPGIPGDPREYTHAPVLLPRPRPGV